MTRPDPVEWSPSDLERAVARHFPSTEREEVLGLLATYGTRHFELDPDRVRRVIVQTSRGSVDRLRRLVGVAERDYRNVLMGDRGPDAPLE